ncbi:tryptophan halogenase [Parvularcula dongshanensis]|uniref:Tryptophan halogenase n=2 Tax=Parvularcula dongshanensis TaxID=1173995 RepID=A0A840I6A4_9PROT|nr:tryptophan halogenase [Parvularcula dongshanensis]
MTAARLATALERQPVEIVVVESSRRPSVGVGEATVPAILDYLRDIDIDPFAVLSLTEGTFKLGIEFVDWLEDGHRFFHPFGLYGAPTRGVSFHQFWLKMRAAGRADRLERYSLCSALAEQNRFRLPLRKPEGDLTVFSWALHFDASLFADVLKKVCRRRGVRHIDAEIKRGELCAAGDNLVALHLDNDGVIKGDLFLDCTGFSSLLLGGAMRVPFTDWSQFLPVDRAITAPTKRTRELAPYTRSTAREAGWQWRIPLQHRVGNGYVYSTRFTDGQTAERLFRSTLEGSLLAEPRTIRFQTGHRESFWVGNVIGIGLAAGFLEPLESTSITLIQTAIERLIDRFPTKTISPALRDDFNRTTTLEYERIRDFLILHYWGNRRIGEEFWDKMREAPLPERLDHKVRLFRDSGRIVRYEWDTFLDPSWISLYAGLNLLPDRHDPLADFFEEDELEAAFQKMQAVVRENLASSRDHADFVAQHCASRRPQSVVNH